MLKRHDAMSDVYQSKQTEKENMRKQKYKIFMKKYLGLLKNDVTQNYVLCEPLRLSVSRSHKISILSPTDITILKLSIMGEEEKT